MIRQCPPEAFKELRDEAQAEILVDALFASAKPSPPCKG